MARYYRNHYRHCGREWTDDWSCQCNDRCPVCNAEIEPYQSDDLYDRKWDFALWLDVYDAEQLRQAALQHPDADPDDDLLDAEGEVDVRACLILLLDPGKLPGCSIESSTAEPAEGGSYEPDRVEGNR